jgi:hypothetical protein
MLPWIVGKNVYAVVALVAIGAMIITAPYIAGRRAERNKQAAEIAKTNSVIVEARGKDEAEIAANDKAGKEVDETVKANLKQTFIMDKDTALWLGLVK